MRFCFLLLFFLCSYGLKAQIQLGYNLHLGLNLYDYQKMGVDQRYQENDSEGQVLNILPSLGLGFWLGNARQLTLGLQGEMEFLPFRLNTADYKGMGAWQTPVSLRLAFPLWRQHSMAWRCSLAAGQLWQQAGVFSASPTAISRQHLVELSSDLAAISTKSDQIRALGLFFRYHWQGEQSGFQLGLRLNYGNAF